MLTLSYGYKLPQNPDTGDVVFPALQTDIQQLNDHAHNGVDSAPLATQSASILAAAWSAAPIGGGVYRQSISMPTGLSYDVAQIWFKVSTGEYVYPSVEKINSTSYYVYTNDNLLQYTAFYR